MSSNQAMVHFNIILRTCFLNLLYVHGIILSIMDEYIGAMEFANVAF